MKNIMDIPLEQRPPLDKERFPDRHMVPLFKLASITAFRYYIWIAPDAVLNAGSRVDPDATRHFLPPEVSDLELGIAARDGLLQSRWIGLDHPDFWRVMEGEYSDADFYDPLLERAGVKTRRTLYRDARHVSLRLQDGVVRLKTLVSDGPGAWSGDRNIEPIILPETVSDLEFGQAVREALAKGR